MYLVVGLVFRPPFVVDRIVRLREDPSKNVSHFRFQNRHLNISAIDGEMRKATGYGKSGLRLRTNEKLPPRHISKSDDEEELT